MKPKTKPNLPPPKVGFQKMPVMNLNKDGSITGPGSENLAKPAKPVDIGIPQPEFEKQIMELVQQGVALPKILSAISQHPEITNIPAAQAMAQAIFMISKGGKT